MSNKSPDRQVALPKALQILIFPVYLIWFPIGLSILGLLGAYAGIAGVISEFRFRAFFRRKGRHISKAQLAQHIGGHGGTIIVESPTVGWNISRAWWTPDDVLSLCPMPPPKKPEPNHPFYEWAYRKYLSTDVGTGLLFSVWNGVKDAAQVGKENPTVKVVDVWSGSLGMRICHSCGVHLLSNSDPVCRECGASLD